MENKKRLTNGNKKVKALLFSLPPVTSCLNHKTCKDSCYAVKAYKQYPNVRSLWDDNFHLVKNNLDQLKKDIMIQLKTTRQKYVRIHQSGDFYSQKYLDMWTDIILSNQDIFFYTYTKVDHILNFSSLELLPNVNVIRSILDGQKNYGSLDYITKLSHDHDAIVCPATLPTGKDIKCGLSCFECMKPNTNVVFLQH